MAARARGAWALYQDLCANLRPKLTTADLTVYLRAAAARPDDLFAGEFADLTEAVREAPSGESA